MTTWACKTCGRPVYPTADVDEVGRQTSNLTWRHWDNEANADHPVVWFTVTP